MGQINELVQNAHDTAREKGWWDTTQSFGTLIALCHSELSEALEEYRAGESPHRIYHHSAKPEGIPIELADVVIRIMDMCGYYEIDLEEAIRQKMEYNETRQYKHGGKLI